MESALLTLVIAAVLVIAICYVISVVPFIPPWLKQIVYVVSGVILVIMVVKLLFSFI